MCNIDSASCDQYDDDDDGGDGHGRPWQALAALATSYTTRATKTKRSWEDGQSRGDVQRRDVRRDATRTGHGATHLYAVQVATCVGTSSTFPGPVRCSHLD